MYKKICLFTLLLIISSNFVFSNEKELLNYNITISPNNPIIGEIDYGNTKSVSTYIYNILKEDFTKEWIEKYVCEDYKFMFTKKYSKLFIDLLPINTIFYCSQLKSFENNNSISVYINEDKILYIILENKTNKIINIKY